MPRRYNEAIHKDSVGALLEQRPPGVGGYHNRRYAPMCVRDRGQAGRSNIRRPLASRLAYKHLPSRMACKIPQQTVALPRGLRVDGQGNTPMEVEGCDRFSTHRTRLVSYIFVHDRRLIFSRRTFIHAFLCMFHCFLLSPSPSVGPQWYKQ